MLFLVRRYPYFWGLVFSETCFFCILENCKHINYARVFLAITPFEIYDRGGSNNCIIWLEFWNIDSESSDGLYSIKLEIPENLQKYICNFCILDSDQNKTVSDTQENFDFSLLSVYHNNLLLLWFTIAC